MANIFRKRKNNLKTMSNERVKKYMQCTGTRNNNNFPAQFTIHVDYSFRYVQSMHLVRVAKSIRPGITNRSNRRNICTYVFEKLLWLRRSYANPENTRRNARRKRPFLRTVLFKIDSTQPLDSLSSHTLRKLRTIK